MSTKTTMIMMIRMRIQIFVGNFSNCNINYKYTISLGYFRFIVHGLLYELLGALLEQIQVRCTASMV